MAATPDANRSFSASTSVVARVTSRPTGLRSKKLIGSRCRCSKISLRRSYIVSWPTHCMMRTCAYCSPKLASIDPTNTMTTHNSPARRVLPVNAAGKSWNDVPVDAHVEQIRSHQLHGRHAQSHRDRGSNPPAVRPQILQQPPRELRVVDLP